MQYRSQITIDRARQGNYWVVTATGLVAKTAIAYSEAEAWSRAAVMAADVAADIAREVVARGGDIAPGASMDQLRELEASRTG